MRFLPAGIILLVLSVISVAAADAPGTTPVSPPPEAAGPVAPATVTPRQEAERRVAIGTAAMKESSATPSRAVDAAVAFSQAIAYYEAAGEIDRVCDLEANIFWCKKRMTADDVAAFLSRQGGDQRATAALAKADAVVAKAVPQEAAQTYFTRAEQFASAHPDDLEGIIAHYLEVAERFAGSELATKAQTLSLKAQAALRIQISARLAASKEAQRETIFSRSAAAAAAAGHQANIPDAATLKMAIDTVRKLFKGSYAQSKPAAKRRLGVRLLKEVPATDDDAPTQYALLSEAIDLSISAADWYSAFNACGTMAQLFAGVDATAKRKEVFARSRSVPTVQAILTLLDHPDDADANTVVGRSFCCEGAHWTVGLPLLAHGSDAALAALASMELLVPTAGAEQVELADRWYALGKAAKAPVQAALLSRSAHWYRAAEPLLTGVTKERVAQRLDELYQLVSEPDIDFPRITVRQWERLPGRSIDIIAAPTRTDTGVTLVAGTRMRVVPHPTDTWSIHYDNIHWATLPSHFDTDATGKVPQEGATRTLLAGGGILGLMQVEVGAAMPIAAGLIDGEGRVLIGPNLPRGGIGNGRIRVKIIELDEESGEAPPAGGAPRLAGDALSRQLAHGDWVPLVPAAGLPGWQPVGGTWTCEGTAIHAEGAAGPTMLLLPTAIANFELACVMTCVHGAAGPGRSEPLTRNVGLEFGNRDGSGREVIARYGWHSWCVEGHFDGTHRHAAEIPQGPLSVRLQVWKGHLKFYHEDRMVAEETVEDAPGQVGLCCYYTVPGALITFTDI